MAGFQVLAWGRHINCDRVMLCSVCYINSVLFSQNIKHGRVIVV